MTFSTLMVCIIQREREEARPQPESIDLDVGWMLYDVFDLGTANDNNSKPSISLFYARVERGVMQVPPYMSGDVRKPQGAHHA